MSADVALFLALAVFNVPLAFFLRGLVSLLVLFFMLCVVYAFFAAGLRFCDACCARPLRLCFYAAASSAVVKPFIRSFVRQDSHLSLVSDHFSKRRRKKEEI